MAKHNPYEYTDFESIIQYFHKLQRGSSDESENLL